MIIVEKKPTDKVEHPQIQRSHCFAQHCRQHEKQPWTIYTVNMKTFWYWISTQYWQMPQAQVSESVSGLKKMVLEHL